MHREAFGLKFFLPAVLAALIIIFTPLLQLLHLSSCSCEHSHYGDFHIVVNNVLNIDVRKACKNNGCSSESSQGNSQPQHDGKNCPICHMYSAIHAGFNVPLSSNTLLTSNVYTQKYVEIQSDVFCVRIPQDASPRAPPAV